MSDTQSTSSGDNSSPSSPAPNPPQFTPPPSIRLKASTAACDVCTAKNRNHTMRRCTKCWWQTCHSQCSPDQGCSYKVKNRDCVHKCSDEHHLIPDPKDRRQHKQGGRSQREPPVTLQQEPVRPETPPPQHHVEPGSPATSTPSSGTETNSANSSCDEYNSDRKHILAGAKCLYALALEALNTEIPELHGDGTEDSVGYALEEAKSASASFNDGVCLTDDDYHEKIHNDTRYEADDDGETTDRDDSHDYDDENDDNAAEPTDGLLAKNKTKCDNNERPSR